jgi:hypothetical protein
MGTGAVPKRPVGKPEKVFFRQFRLARGEGLLFRGDARAYFPLSHIRTLPGRSQDD